METTNLNKRVYDLEDRLVRFAAMIGELLPAIVKTAEGRTLSNQLIRSGTSPALNYAEALASESMADFIHKISICLKELKESRVILKIIVLRELSSNSGFAKKINDECSELVAIFITSVNTARKNAGKNQ